MRLIDNQVGATISSIAKAHGITLKELAHRSGLSYHSIQNYTSGQQMPGFKVILRLSEAFDLDMNIFRGKAESKIEQPFFGLELLSAEQTSLIQTVITALGKRDCGLRVQIIIDGAPE